MKNSSNDEWQYCPPAVIDQLVKRSKVQSRLSSAKRIVLASAVLFTVIAVTMLSWANRIPTREERRDQMIRTVSCENVGAMFEQYQLGQLADGMTRRVCCHLRRCPKCKCDYATYCQKNERTNRHDNSVARSP